MFLVSPGYTLRFNATEYEFDINVYTPIETVVFEALIIAEDANDLVLMGVNFGGSEADYGPFSINGMDVSLTLQFPFSTNTLLTIATDQRLYPDDNEAVYEFSINVFAIDLGSARSESQVDVILHEFGKILCGYS